MNKKLNERVYDAWQVYIVNEDGTRELYGEYETYSDAEKDIEACAYYNYEENGTGIEDYEIVKKY